MDEFLKGIIPNVVAYKGRFLQSLQQTLEMTLRSGIIAACHKRPVSAADIEKVVNSIEQLAYNNLQEEITTRQIGEMVMDSLRKLDEVAYIRFASVYRSFTDIPTFMEELKALVGDHEDKSEEAKEPTKGE